MRTKNEFNNKKVVSLMDEVKKNKNEITQLNSIVTKFSKQLNPIIVYFRTLDASINDLFYCSYIEQFSCVEERLYQRYPQLRQTNNIFLFYGKQIERDKSVLLNEITDQAIILIATQYS